MRTMLNAFAITIFPYLTFLKNYPKTNDKPGQDCRVEAHKPRNAR